MAAALFMLFSPDSYLRIRERLTPLAITSWFQAPAYEFPFKRFLNKKLLIYRAVKNSYWSIRSILIEGIVIFPPIVDWYV